MSTIPQILKETRSAMDKALESSKREFGVDPHRQGVAEPARHRARRSVRAARCRSIRWRAVAAPEPRLLTVTPWDKGLAQAIEKAIRDSDLGLNPATQGSVIRVPLPALNEERRKELVKVVHKLAEEGRIAIRHARTHGRDALKKLEKASRGRREARREGPAEAARRLHPQDRRAAEGEGSRDHGGVIEA